MNVPRPVTAYPGRWIITSVRRGVLALVLLVPLLYWAWGVRERRLVHERIELYHGYAIRILPEDYEDAAEDSPDNPVPEWQAAGDALILDERDYVGLYDYVCGFGSYHPQAPPAWAFFTTAHFARFAKIVRDNAEALSHVDAASRMAGRPDWHLGLGTPVILRLDEQQFDRKQQRRLATLVCAAALDAHHRGDDAHAMQRVRQLMLLGRSLYRLPTRWPATDIGLAECGLILAIRPDLKIAPPGDGQRTAAPDQVRDVIAELLDQRPVRTAQRDAVRTERMLVLDTVNWMATDPEMPAAKRFLMAPFNYRDAQLLLDRCDFEERVATSQDWPTCQVLLNMLPDPSIYNSSLHGAFQTVMGKEVRHALPEKSVYELLAQQQLTALRLALRWYAAEHDGRPPQRLELLVPDYLPQMPTNPMVHKAAVAPDNGVTRSGNDSGGKIE